MGNGGDDKVGHYLAFGAMDTADEETTAHSAAGRHTIPNDNIRFYSLRLILLEKTKSYQQDLVPLYIIITGLERVLGCHEHNHF